MCGNNWGRLIAGVDGRRLDDQMKVLGVHKRMKGRFIKFAGHLEKIEVDLYQTWLV